MASAEPPRSAEKVLYKYQADLPSLPVPDLEATATKLLRSIKALASSDEEYEHAEGAVKEFLSGVGPKLHEMLVERAKESRNWLEEW